MTNLCLLSALVKSIACNNIATVIAVLQYDAVGRKKFNVNHSLHDSLLHKAVRNGNYELCKMLLKIGAGVNLLNLDNQSPLNMAETIGESSICKILVRKRKENKVIYKKALHVCAKENDLIKCKINMYRGVNVNETDEKMQTPLPVAMIFASDAICNLFLRYGADVHAKDIYNDDPIQQAFYYGRFRLRERLLHNLSYIR